MEYEWMELYAELLRNYLRLEASSEIEREPIHQGWLFTLHDINLSGTPDLIIWESNPGRNFIVYSAYAFENGGIVPLEITERFRGRGFGWEDSIFFPPNNVEGIITMLHSEVPLDSYTLARRNESSLFVAVSVIVNSNYGLCYVRGADVTPMVGYSARLATNHHIDWHNSWIYQGYVLTTRDETSRVFRNYFGDEDLHPNPLIWLNEENITNYVFGWQASPRPPFLMAEPTPLPTPPFTIKATPIPKSDTELDWMEAYSAVLRSYAATSFEADEWGTVWDSHAFTLQNINHSGTPDLIIWRTSPSLFFSAYSAYAFENGEVVPLEIAEWFGGRGLGVFFLPNNAAGFITTQGESGFSRFQLIRRQGNSLFVEVSAHRNWTPRQGGLAYELLYIRGVSVIPTEFPNALYELWWTGHEEWLRINPGYVLTAEEEFFRVFELVTSKPGLDELYMYSPSSPLLSINEANIQNHVFGWQ